MNGQILKEDTIEGRLAMVAKSVRRIVEARYRKSGGQHEGSPIPGYFDYREAFRPFLREWEIWIRIDQARKTSSRALTEVVKELADQLPELEKEIEILREKGIDL
jgi:hypothetical protein